MTMRTAYGVVFLLALVGVMLGAMAYFSPKTGVDGTAGALLALIGAAAVTLGALLTLMPTVRGWAFGVLKLLILLGAALTATAAYFLMQYAFAIAMALAFLGLLVALAMPSRRRTA
jgi:quinoprotein glucose dehydrogenase